MKRKIRRFIENAMPLLGMGIIFGSVLFGPSSLQLQVFLVLLGILILEAGVWGLTSGLLPNERRYLELRAEGDHFLGLIRILNQAAVARNNGEESDERFRNTRAQMHTSVERMGEVAGKDAFAEREALEEKEALEETETLEEAEALEETEVLEETEALEEMDTPAEKDAFTEIEELVIEAAETALGEVRMRAEQAHETPAEAVDRELDPARRNG